MLKNTTIESGAVFCSGKARIAYFFWLFWWNSVSERSLYSIFRKNHLWNFDHFFDFFCYQKAKAVGAPMDRSKGNLCLMMQKSAFRCIILAPSVCEFLWIYSPDQGDIPTCKKLVKILRKTGSSWFKDVNRGGWYWGRMKATQPLPFFKTFSRPQY